MYVYAYIPTTGKDSFRTMMFVPFFLNLFQSGSKSYGNWSDPSGGSALPPTIAVWPRSGQRP